MTLKEDFNLLIEAIIFAGIPATLLITVGLLAGYVIWGG